MREKEIEISNCKYFHILSMREAFKESEFTELIQTVDRHLN